MPVLVDDEQEVQQGPWQDYKKPAPAAAPDGPWAAYAPKKPAPNPLVPAPAPLTEQGIEQANAGTEVDAGIQKGASGRGHLNLFPSSDARQFNHPSPPAQQSLPLVPPSQGALPFPATTRPDGIPIDKGAAAPSAPAAAPGTLTGQVATVSAYEPSTMEQLKRTVANSAIGRSLQYLPKLADALDLHPSEALQSSTYEQHGQQLFVPEEAEKAVSEYFGPRKFNDPAQAPSATENRVTGALTAAGGLTSGKSMATIAGTAIAAGLTAGVVNPATAQVLSRLASGGFSADMLYGLYQQHTAYKKAVDQGDIAAAQKIQGEMGVNGVLALLTAAHAAGVSPHAEMMRGDYGERGVKVSAGPVSADVGYRPAYREPGPWEDYGEGSTIKPAKVTAAVTVGGRRFGTPAVGPWTDYQPPAAPESKELPAPREVVQDSTDPEAIRKSAAEQEKPTVSAVEKAVESVPGANVDGSRVKDADSQANKADRDKPVETQKDHLGVRVAADTPEAHREAVGAIAQTMPVVGTEPLDNNGLAGTQVFVETGKPGDANRTSEIQVLPTSQVAALKETDDLYDQQKKALAAGDTAKAEELGKKITEIHEQALEKGKSETSVKSDDKGTSETKYKFGSTQANIPNESDAAKGLAVARAKIDKDDLNPTSYGGDETGLEPDAHVTVRYGIKSDDTAAIEDFIRSQSPFEAKLGATSMFPASASSDGGAVIKADVEAPELHRINEEIEKHGEFAESDFDDYVPHATVAYVKPDAAEKYVGMKETEGKTFQVRSIAITDKNGDAKEIPLKGGNTVAPAGLEGGRGESPEQPVGGGLSSAPTAKTSPPAQPVKTGATVKLPDGRTGVVKGISPKGDVEVKLDGGGRAKAPRAQVEVVDKSAPTEGVTAGIPGHEKPSHGAIAVDLDKTLAEYDTFKGAAVIGKPIPEQVDQVKQMLKDGEDVWIFTARAAHPEAIPAVKAWTKEHIGQELPVTNVKYPEFARFIDDRSELPVQMQEGAKDADKDTQQAEGVATRPDEREGEVRGDDGRTEGGGRSTGGREDVETRPERPAAEAGKEVAPIAASDLGSTFYSNPLDPALFKRLVGEPLMQMAEPLREELERRGSIADVANSVHDALQRLDRTNKATTLEAKGTAKAFEQSGFTKEDGDKVFAHLEEPSVKLTPRQEELRDKWIIPLDQRAAFQRVVTLLIKSGKFSLDDILSGKVSMEDVQKYAPQQDYYQHRIAADKSNFVQKMLGDSMKRFRAPGSSLSRAFSSGKRSVFAEIRGDGGEREAVAVKNGRVTQFRMGKDGNPELKDLGAYRKGFVDTQELADEAAKPLERKLAALKKELGILTGSKGRESVSARRIANIEAEIKSLDKQIDAVQQSIGNAPAKMTDDEALQARIAPIQKVIDRLQKKKSDATDAKKAARLTERIQENQQAINDIREQHEGPALEGSYWRDKDGNLWKFNRGTTKFITERTGQKYHANAMLSSLVNYMETNKAMNAAVVMERTKGLLEDEGMALKTDNPANVPDGWKPTTLLQMHGYYFPAHIADSFDQFDYLNSRGQPNILERANRFIIQSVLMNPLMHGKNIAANYLTGKVAEAISGKVVLPSFYARNIEAGVKAVNTLRDIGGSEYRRLLRLGLDLQGADSSFDNTTKDILRSFTDQLDKDKQSNIAMSALLGVGDAAKWLSAKNHLATFGINDLFLLQSFYARQAELTAKHVPNADEAARDWAHQQVAEYTTPIRFGGSSALGRLMENPNISAFWRYHFGGILRPVMNAVKEAAGSFKPEDETAGDGKERNSRGQTRAEARINAIARLAVMIAFAVYVYPKILDKLAKKITGDEQAKAPRGGVLGFASDIAETAKGERSIASTLGSVFTPALGTEELVEAGINRDFFTGKHIMGTNVGAEDKVKQLATWLGSKSTPGSMTHRLDQGKGKQVLYSLLGFTFPMEHGLKEAAEIRSEASGSNPSDPQKAKVFQSILAAAEQSRRTNGKDTSLKDVLLASGNLNPGQRRELILAVHETPIAFAVQGLEQDEDVWRVFQHSTDEEKHELADDRRASGRLFKYSAKLRHAGDNDKAAEVRQKVTAAR